MNYNDAISGYPDFRYNLGQEKREQISEALKNAKKDLEYFFDTVRDLKITKIEPDEETTVISCLGGNAMTNVYDYVHHGPIIDTDSGIERPREVEDYYGRNSRLKPVTVNSEGIAIVVIDINQIEHIISENEDVKNGLLLEISKFINEFIEAMNNKQAPPIMSDILRAIASMAYVDHTIAGRAEGADEPSLEMAMAKALACALSGDPHSVEYRQGAVSLPGSSFVLAGSGQASVVDEEIAEYCKSLLAQ